MQVGEWLFRAGGYVKAFCKQFETIEFSGLQQQKSERE
jgi:hypothetical protein